MRYVFYIKSWCIIVYLQRKGRAKQVLLVLRRTALEVHKSVKEYKNSKPAKHRIELADLFNLSLDLEPNQVKQECITIMTPVITYFILPNDPDSTLNDWFELLMERVRGCRADKLMRTVFREEFFEAAWDVTILKKPKLRKDVAKFEKCDDLVDKLADIQGRKRLCVSATSFLLFKMGAIPTTDKDQPYDKDSFVELPVSYYQKRSLFIFILF